MYRQRMQYHTLPALAHTSTPDRTRDSLVSNARKAAALFRSAVRTRATAARPWVVGLTHLIARSVLRGLQLDPRLHMHLVPVSLHRLLSLLFAGAWP